MVKKAKSKQTFESSEDVINMLYNEFQVFRDDMTEKFKEQNDALKVQSDALLKQGYAIYGNGSKGIVQRLDEVEQATEQNTKEIANINTKEKVKIGVIGAVCAIFSGLGGVVAYGVSVYFTINPHT